MVEQEDTSWDDVTLKLPATVQSIVPDDTIMAGMVDIKFRTQMRVILSATNTMPLKLTVKIVEVMGVM